MDRAISEIRAVLEGASVINERANGLALQQFSAVFTGLFAAGWRFVEPLGPSGPAAAKTISVLAQLQDDDVEDTSDDESLLSLDPLPSPPSAPAASNAHKSARFLLAPPKKYQGDQFILDAKAGVASIPRAVDEATHLSEEALAAAAAEAEFEARARQSFEGLEEQRLQRQREREQRARASLTGGSYDAGAPLRSVEPSAARPGGALRKDARPAQAGAASATGQRLGTAANANEDDEDGWGLAPTRSSVWMSQDVEDGAEGLEMASVSNLFTLGNRSPAPSGSTPQSTNRRIPFSAPTAVDDEYKPKQQQKVATPPAKLKKSPSAAGRDVSSVGKKNGTKTEQRKTKAT
jgi:hypothetical protein